MKNLLTIYFLFLICPLLAQEISYTIPEGYEDVITKEDYKFLVDESVKVISKHYSVSAVNDGGIELQEGEDYATFNLHNLILRLADIEKQRWKEIVQAHFDGMYESMEQQKQMDPTKFETLVDHLSIRVYPKSFVEERGATESLVLQEKIEGTYSVLMLDLPSAFSAVQKQVFELWGKSTDEVFEKAQQNINQQEFTQASENFEVNGKAFEAHFIENEDYGASIALDLAYNAPELVGEWGSAIAIPNNGIINICKISKENPLDFVLFIQKFKPVVEQFHQQHPRPVSTDFFWYYKGKFTKINVIVRDGGVEVISPLGLTELMTEKE